MRPRLPGMTGVMPFMASLSDVAELTTSDDGDNQTFTVTVRDEQGSQIYAGTLTFAGYWSDEPASS